MQKTQQKQERRETSNKPDGEFDHKVDISVLHPRFGLQGIFLRSRTEIQEPICVEDLSLFS